jgi:hypothetical protein
VLPLADFGTAHITSAGIDGSKIGRHHPTKIIMLSRGTRKDSVTGLTDGRKFSATWRHS